MKRVLIIGDAIRVRGARGRARPLLFYKVIHRLPELSTGGVGVIHRRTKALPQVLSSNTTTYILPHKKYTLK